MRVPSVELLERIGKVLDLPVASHTCCCDYDSPMPLKIYQKKFQTSRCCAGPGRRVGKAERFRGVIDLPAVQKPSLCVARYERRVGGCGKLIHRVLHLTGWWDRITTLCRSAKYLWGACWRYGPALRCPSNTKARSAFLSRPMLHSTA